MKLRIIQKLDRSYVVQKKVQQGFLWWKREVWVDYYPHWGNKHLCQFYRLEQAREFIHLASQEQPRVIDEIKG